MLSIMSVEKLLDCNAETVEDSFKSEVMWSIYLGFEEYFNVYINICIIWLSANLLVFAQMTPDFELQTVLSDELEYPSTPLVMFQICLFNLILNWMLLNTVEYKKTRHCFDPRGTD